MQKTLVSLALVGAALFLAAGWAPAAPYNQNAGSPDLAIGDSFEADCRVCHDTGVPDRHHLLHDQAIPAGSLVPYPDADGDGFPDTTYGCLNCHDQNFTVVADCVACHTSPVGTVPDGGGPGESPLTVTPAPGGDLTLGWNPSCGVTDTDYSIYAGTLGDFTSHEALLCSTGEATAATFAPPPGSTYFLVVPRNHWSEGSYGLDSDGAQRPPSVSACLSQSIGCP